MATEITPGRMKATFVALASFLRPLVRAVFFNIPVNQHPSHLILFVEQHQNCGKYAPINASFIIKEYLLQLA